MDPKKVEVVEYLHVVVCGLAALSQSESSALIKVTTTVTINFLGGDLERLLF